MRLTKVRLFRYSVTTFYTSTLGRPLSMSLITSNNRLTVKTYAFVPSLDDFDLDLPSIKRATRSVSSASSRSANRGIGAGVPIKEGCMVTKVAKYTHQLAHFVNAVRKGDPRPLVSRNSSGLLNHI